MFCRFYWIIPKSKTISRMDLWSDDGKLNFFYRMMLITASNHLIQYLYYWYTMYTMYTLYTIQQCLTMFVQHSTKLTQSWLGIGLVDHIAIGAIKMVSKYWNQKNWLTFFLLSSETASLNGAPYSNPLDHCFLAGLKISQIAANNCWLLQSIRLSEHSLNSIAYSKFLATWFEIHKTVSWSVRQFSFFE